MRIGALLPAIIAAISLPFHVNAIFSDEAYVNDYHHALLGIPQSHTTFFHRPSTTTKASLLYTLSEKFVLGAVNPKDGSVVWRQRLAPESNGTSASYLRPDEDGAVISAVDGKVQAWNAADGRIVWEWQGAGEVRGLEVLARDGQKGVAVYSDEGSRTVLRKLAADTGDVVWEYIDVRYVIAVQNTRHEICGLILSSGDQAFGLSSTPEYIYTISLYSALLKGYKIKVTAFDIITGKQESQHTLSSDGEVTLEDAILYVGAKTASPLLIWTDKSFKTLKVNIIGTKHIASINVAQGDDPIERIHVHASDAVGAPTHFLIHYQAATSHWAETYHTEPTTGATTKAYILPKLGGIGAFSPSKEGSKIYFTRHTDFEISLVSSTSNEVLYTWPIRPKSHGGLADPQGVLHAVSEVVSKSPSNYAVRSALTLSSGDWELVRNGDPVWIRSESVTGAVAATWLDAETTNGLAQELAAEAHGGLIGAYTHRLRRHTRDLVTYFPSWIESLPNAIMRLFSGDQIRSATAQSQRDSFGFDRTVLIATERGRIIALQSGKQGKILWNVKAVNLPQHQKWHVLGIEVQDGIALIRGLEGEFLRITASTGEILHYQPGGLISSLKTSQFVPGISGKQIAVPVNKDGSIKEVPKSELRDGTIIVTQGDDGIVRGWAVSQAGKPYVAWNFIPRPNEEISSLTSPPAHNTVASIGKALGDRNVLYKYLNPNLLIITTVERAASRATIYLLDSASGDILESTSHLGVDTSEPIPLTLAENWIAYSLYLNPANNGKDSTGQTPITPKGHQLIVSEFFESAIPNDRGPLGYSSNFSSIHPLPTSNGDTTTNPHVISQAYLLPGPISKITTTSTLQSITPRSLICILPQLNALISIPRSVADPRRPVGRDPTPAELEEGLFRHNAHLDFEPKWILTHKREVMGLTNVITLPTLLESTSLVFAYGELDIFGTRVAPIGGFDMLGKGFSRFQLVATVVGLAVLTGALAPTVSYLFFLGSTA